MDLMESRYEVAEGKVKRKRRKCEDGYGFFEDLRVAGRETRDSRENEAQSAASEILTYFRIGPT
jgi:hypothetical protein